jgi:hypothetical protein
MTRPIHRRVDKVRLGVHPSGPRSKSKSPPLGCAKSWHDPAITAEAYEAAARTLALGTVAVEPQVKAKGATG